MLNVEYVVTDAELGDEEITTLETVAYSIRHSARIVDMPCNELGVGEFVEVCFNFSN